jgi:thiol-disulfide isomerase/thioredoxin
VRAWWLGLIVAVAACGGVSGDVEPRWPDLVVEDLATGEATRSADTLPDDRASIAVVTVWAVWCQPCRKELPALQELSQRRDEVVVVGINHGDDPATARAFLDELGVTYRSLRDPDGRLVQALGVVSLPATFVVTSQGSLVWSRLGVVQITEIEAAIDDALDVSTRR